MRTLAGLLVSSFLLATVSFQANADAAAEVIKVTKDQWAAEMRKDYKAQLSTIADEYTEFNSDVPTRIDGKAISQRLYEASQMGTGEVIAAEMVNEKVQVYGDVAILSYNFVGSLKTGDGSVKPILAKSTRVYHKRKGGWMLVHANFAPVTAPPN